MVSFTSMLIPETLLSPQVLRVRAGLLANDLDLWMMEHRSYRRWFYRYGYLVRIPQVRLADDRGFTIRLSNEPFYITIAKRQLMLRAYETHYSQLGWWGRLKAYFTGDKACYERLQGLTKLQTVLSQVAKTPEEMQSLPRYVKDAMSDAMAEVQASLPRRSRLLAPLQSIQRSWQSFVASVSQFLSQQSPAMFLNTSDAPQFIPADVSSQPSTISAIAIGLVAPSLHREVGFALEKSIRHLTNYGMKTRLEGQRLTLDAQLQALLGVESLEMKWQAHVRRVSRYSSQKLDTKTGAMVYRWFGVRVAQPDRSEERFLLHYGRLKEGIQRLLTVLQNVTAAASIIDATTHLSNLLWEGVLLSQGGSQNLWRFHHDLIAELNVICQRYTEYGVLSELAKTLDCLDHDVVARQVAQPSRRFFSEAMSHYQIQLSAKPMDWRLTHTQAMETLCHVYTGHQRRIRSILRGVEPTIERQAQIQSFNALCEPLNNALRWSLVFAKTAEEARASRENYHEQLMQLEGFLRQLIQGQPSAMAKAEALVVMQSAKTSVKLDEQAQFNKGIEEGVMAIKPELLDVVQAYLKEHPMDPLVNYSLQYDVPVELYYAILKKMARDFLRQGDAAIHRVLVSEHHQIKEIIIIRVARAATKKAEKEGALCKVRADRLEMRIAEKDMQLAETNARLAILSKKEAERNAKKAAKRQAAGQVCRVDEGHEIDSASLPGTSGSAFFQSQSLAFSSNEEVGQQIPPKKLDAVPVSSSLDFTHR